MSDIPVIFSFFFLSVCICNSRSCRRDDFLEYLVLFSRSNLYINFPGSPIFVPRTHPISQEAISLHRTHTNFPGSPIFVPQTHTNFAGGRSVCSSNRCYFSRKSCLFVEHIPFSRSLCLFFARTHKKLFHGSRISSSSTYKFSRSLYYLLNY